MNREIKFRVWNKLTKQYIKNNIIISLDGKVKEVFFGEINGEEPDCIIQQFTSLKDKNNKEIYEGDIVKCPDLNPPEYTNTLSIVEYHASCFCYRDISSNKIEPIYGFIRLSEQDDDGEIIGNIFENPELLK